MPGSILSTMIKKNKARTAHIPTAIVNPIFCNGFSKSGILERRETEFEDVFRWHKRINESRLPLVSRLALSRDPLVAKLPESHSQGRITYLVRHRLQPVRDFGVPFDCSKRFSLKCSTYQSSAEATSDRI